MSFQSRLKKLRTDRKLTQQQIANKLGITRQAYGYYESEKEKREPDHATTQKIAEIFDVSVDYLLGITDLKVNVAGKQIHLSPNELKVLEEIKKYPSLFHDLANAPDKKIRQLIKMWEVIKMDLEEDDDRDDIIDD
ncbi:helix-turn-helix transcriptional regulator [Bacillus sp. JJ1566]|uniref:helix-turn-helix domain-containing protein n=1 Tax=Bacillus sp. JJ1566 TaxID=3122961 RepID=UPI002FFE14B0